MEMKNETTRRRRRRRRSRQRQQVLFVFVRLDKGVGIAEQRTFVPPKGFESRTCSASKTRAFSNDQKIENFTFSCVQSGDETE